MHIVEIFLYKSSFNRLGVFGSDSREIEYYNEYSKYSDVSIIDYDTSDLEEKFEVISKPINFDNFKWSIDKNNIVSDKLKKGVDIIRTKQLFGSWLGLILSKKTNSKLVIRMGYSYAQSKYYEGVLGKLLFIPLRFLELYIVKKSDGIIYGSEYLQDIFKKTNTKSIITRNPISDSFVFQNKNKRKRKYKFIVVGRLIKSKGSDLIQQIDKVISSGIIIGKNIDNLIISNNILIEHVKNSEISNYLSQSQYYLSLSRTEGSPKAALEAIFSGCIPILSDIPAHRDLINDLGYGYLINNKKDIVSRLSSNDNIYCPIKHSVFTEKWNMKSVVKQEIKFIKDICAEY